MNDLGDADSYLPAGAFTVSAPRTFPQNLWTFNLIGTAGMLMGLFYSDQWSNAMPNRGSSGEPPCVLNNDPLIKLTI